MTFDATRITPPAFEPVTLAQAKAHCRVTLAAEDDLFTGVLIPSARQSAELLLRRAIMLQAWRVSFDDFCGRLVLPWPTLQAVTSVQYRDGAGAWQTVDPAAYEANPAAKPANLVTAYGCRWPAVLSQPASVRVEYTAGYATGTEAEQQAAVPPGVRQWLLMRIGTLYKFREQLQAGVTAAELPAPFVDGLLDSERIWSRA